MLKKLNHNSDHMIARTRRMLNGLKTTFYNNKLNAYIADKRKSVFMIENAESERIK